MKVTHPGTVPTTCYTKGHSVACAIVDVIKKVDKIVNLYSNKTTNTLLKGHIFND